jgi:hypothetical protein
MDIGDISDASYGERVTHYCQQTGVFNEKDPIQERLGKMLPVKC